MAIPVTNIPVLTGEVAERFIEHCEYNAQHLRGSEYQGPCAAANHREVHCREVLH
jgi:hypothetical protein